MHKLAGRQTDPVARAARDAKIVAHYKEHKRIGFTCQVFKLNRIKVGQILKREGALDERSEQTMSIVHLPSVEQIHALHMLVAWPDGCPCRVLSDHGVGPATRLILERKNWAERVELAGILPGWRITAEGATLAKLLDERSEQTQQRTGE